VRVLFLIQGEGRGHLSQALALRELLVEGGHELCGVFVGADEERALPGYLAERLGFAPERFPSPVILSDRKKKGVSMVGTALANLARTPAYLRAIRQLRGECRRRQPDLIVNFYDSVAGMAFRPGRGGWPPMVAVGHQYLLGHPDTPPPPAGPVELLPFTLMNRLSAPPGTLRLALSFREMEDGPTADTRVVPPLLRRQILDAVPVEGDHLLVYVLNDGYGEAIANWHRAHPEVELHGFWHRPGAPESEEVRPGLTFHQLSDTRFIEMMRSCRGFVGTAGFESVAEALWLGKPVMVVPTGNHVEQSWNAREAVAASAGIASESFDLTPFLHYLDASPPPRPDYREWVLAGRARILTLLEEAVGEAPGARP